MLFAFLGAMGPGLNKLRKWSVGIIDVRITTYPSFIPVGYCMTKEITCILELYPTHMTTCGQHWKIITFIRYLNRTTSSKAKSSIKKGYSDESKRIGHLVIEDAEQLTISLLSDCMKYVFRIWIPNYNACLWQISTFVSTLRNSWKKIEYHALITNFLQSPVWQRVTKLKWPIIASLLHTLLVVPSSFGYYKIRQFDVSDLLNGKRGPVEGQMYLHVRLLYQPIKNSRITVKTYIFDSTLDLQSVSMVRFF